MDFREFLRQALPPLGLCWKAHYRRSVRRRCVKRMDALRLRSWRSYWERIQQDPDEQERFYRLLTVTVSRFCRDLPVFRYLEEEIFPNLLEVIQAGETLRAWSAGCAGGEEPYSLAMIWEKRFKRYGKLVVEAQDLDPECIARATRGQYKASSLREIGSGCREKYFQPSGDQWRLRARVARWVRFFQGDIVSPPSCEAYHLILCRNVTFTYGAVERRMQALDRLRNHLVSGGYLVIGRKERLPYMEGWREVSPGLGIFESVDWR